MFWTKLIVGLTIAWSFLPGNAFAEAQKAPVAPVAQAAGAPAAAAPQYAVMQPYRTWITVKSYEMINNGDAQNPISNVRLEMIFPGAPQVAAAPGKSSPTNPNDKKLELPEAGQFWTVGNGQKQEINRTYELPYDVIAQDGFSFVIQMVRKGRKMLPCKFEVAQLSQFNRSYFCHTDLQWQMDQKITEDKLDKEGIEVRVFTDRNTPKKEIPKDALALR